MKKYLVYILTVLLYSNTSCEDFVEIDSPNFKIVNENVFSKESTATAAMQGIYNQLRLAFFTEAASTHMGMSGNLLKPRFVNISYNPFYKHEINTFEGADATDNLDIWSSAYNIVYLTNSLIEGVQNSSTLSMDLSNNLIGQGLVIRAFTYFYLTNFYGEVPLLLSTNYNKNAIATRATLKEVRSQIKSDLEEAIILLESFKTYPEGERLYVTQNVATALLSRVFLYNKDWIMAEELSSKIIRQSGKYEILSDLDKVFLRNNKEAIWQIDPNQGGSSMVTAEGAAYVVHPFVLGGIKGAIVLSSNFIKEYSTSDKRFSHWIGIYQESNETYPFINKYKEYANSIDNTESSVVLRLAEQYLTRSEARAHQGKLDLAIKDIDIIRKRAGLELISNTYPEITKKELLDTILKERKKELFGEYGHYWLDLKRTNTVSEEFTNNPSWEDTDFWYPIPEQERLKNPNLGQNDGY